MTDDHLDARLDALLADARRTYNPPTDLPDVEGMWATIDEALPPLGSTEVPRLAVMPPARRRIWQSTWLRMAAVLFLGVLIGRASIGRAPAAAGVVETAAGPSEPAPLTAEAIASEEAVTTEYLGRTSALLAALPAALESRRADPAYLAQAEALLLQTRLLLDSPAATDPALRSLFDDLEIVLAQVVRLRADRDPTRIDFLEQALEQRDVLPRLREAVADAAAD
jgi:hypothetical protein